MHGHGAAAERRAVGAELDVRHVAAVVEPRLALESEAHLPANDADHADQAVLVRGPLAGNRHEVDHLADAVHAQESRDEDRRARQIQLLGDVVDAVGRDAEVTTSLMIEQRSEDARRVEPRCAEPVDRAVGRDQRSGLQVSDQAMVFYRWIGIHCQPPVNSVRRCSAYVSCQRGHLALGVGEAPVSAFRRFPSASPMATLIARLMAGLTVLGRRLRVGDDQSGPADGNCGTRAFLELVLGKPVQQHPHAGTRGGADGGRRPAPAAARAGP